MMLPFPTNLDYLVQRITDIAPHVPHESRYLLYDQVILRLCLRELLKKELN